MADTQPLAGIVLAPTAPPTGGTPIRVDPAKPRSNRATAPTDIGKAPKPVAIRITAPPPPSSSPRATSVPARPTVKAARVPLKARLLHAGQTFRKGLQSVPWQAWRTLIGLLLLTLAWVLIARACERRKTNMPETPPTGRPIIEATCPAPEPYLD